MPLIGPNLRAARAQSLYTAATRQPWWLAAIMVGVIFLFYSLLQMVTGGIAHYFAFGNLPDFTSAETASSTNFIKGIVVGIFPAAVMTLFIVWWVAGWKNPSVDGLKDRGLPLHLPALGSLGWAVVIFGFVILMYAIFFLVFAALGIDPKDYMPNAGGLDDGGSSSAGLVEKTIADLADEPLLFALALPGIAIGAPVIEEILFRGAVFSALRQTAVGNAGAVVLTAAVWAVIHGSSAPWLFVGLLFLMGIVLGLALLRFGSLWVPIVLHCVWNGMVSLAFLSGAAVQ